MSYKRDRKLAEAVRDETIQIVRSHYPGILGDLMMKLNSIDLNAIVAAHADQRAIIRQIGKHAAQEGHDRYQEGQYTGGETQPLTVPEGWQLVPIEPTKTMMNYGQGQLAKRGLYGVYKTMLAVAPKLGEKL